MKEIITTFEYPPIPIRQFDWSAVYDQEDSPVGWGETEEEAIQNLLDQDDD